MWVGRQGGRNGVCFTYKALLTNFIQFIKFGALYSIMVCMELKRLRERIPSCHFKGQMGLYSVKDIWCHFFKASHVSCVKANYSYQQILKFYCNVPIFLFVIIQQRAAFQGRLCTPFSFTTPFIFQMLTWAFSNQAEGATAS